MEITPTALDALEAELASVPVASSAYCPDAESVLRFHLHVFAPRLVGEIRAHRATMKRLEEFCLELRSDSVIMGGHVTIGDRQIDGGITRYIATELRKRMKAP